MAFVPVTSDADKGFEQVIDKDSTTVKAVPETETANKLVFSLEFQRAPARVREAQVKLETGDFVTTSTTAEVEAARRMAQAMGPPMFVASLDSNGTLTKVKVKLAVDPFTGAWHATLPESEPMGINAGFALVTMPATLEEYVRSNGAVQCNVFLHTKGAAGHEPGPLPGDGPGDGDSEVRHNNDDFE